MNLLVSICNINGKSKSGLLLLDERLSSCRYLKLPNEVLQAGMTGIALSDQEIIVVSQDGPINVLDRKTFALKSVNPSQISKDTHSIMLHEGNLYAVATGLNAIVVMAFQDGKLSGERVYWEMSGTVVGTDSDHLNSICIHEGRILVTGFGLKSSKLWSTAMDGFVMDIHSGIKLFNNLSQPHTLTSCCRSLLLCESAKGRVLDLGRGRKVAVNGYARGLCEGPEGIYVAVSRGRTVSKSTGLIITNPQDEGAFQGQAGIYLIDRDTFCVKKTFEVGDFEFYDLAMVGDEALSWPLHDPA